MPVDPWIARGVEAPDVGRTLNALANLELERQRTNEFAKRTALDERALAMRENQFEQAQQSALDERQVLDTYAELQAVKRGPPEAQAAWLAQQAQGDPDFARSPYSGLPPEQALPMMEEHLAALLGRQVEQAPGPISQQRVGGATFYTQDGKTIAHQLPPQPQQYGPESYSTFTDAQGRVWQIGNRGTIQPTELKGVAPGAQASAAAQQKAEAAAAAERSRTENAIVDASNVLTAVSDAEALAGFFSTGFVGSIMQNIGGTSAANLRAAVDPIKSGVGFGRLQRMREESKTGGALGNVSEMEIRLLQSTIASLDTTQSETRLRVSLARIKAQYERAMAAYRAAMDEKARMGVAEPATAGLPPVEDRVRSYYGGGQ